MNNVIQVQGLKKNYGKNEVLKGLSFNVAKGEIFALLGINGAGKTTALECIEGLRRYDSGTITVNGKIGIQLQSATLQSFIKPIEAINLFAKWNKTIPDKSLLASLGIDEISKKSYVSLSTGQKRRLHLALALVGNPDIVFLDEPTAGLDVEGKLALHALIRKIKEQGKTIVLASHDMAEVESLSDRIAIIRDGIIVFVGTVSQLRERVGSRFNVVIKTSETQEEYTTDNIVDTLLPVFEDYKRQGVHITDIKADRGTLEEHFINFTRSNEE